MIAYRLWNPATWLVLYVSDLPGPRGIPDWGYNKDPKKAINLSPYWAKRFAAHCKRCGAVAHFTGA